jgi:uncharacterized protein (TIGR04255 family)
LTERRHYRNAPIIEATISFEIVPSTFLVPEDLFALNEFLKAEYPDAAEEYLYEEQTTLVEPGGPPERDHVHKHIGYGFRSADKKRVLRVSVDSFDFSVMGPYDSWEPFRDEALQLWGFYKKVCQVEAITRIGVRYINRIDLPSVPSAKLDNYLKIYPEIPDGWPSGVAIHNFFMQVQAWQEDLGSNLIVNQAPGRPPGPGIASIRLDFDLSREQYADPWLVESEEEVWDFLERLHLRKNVIFEESITEATRRLIR